MRSAVIPRSLSIKQKLRLIIMITVGTALILASAAVWGYDYFAFRATMRNDLGVLAEIFGSNSTAALSFGDTNAGEEILSGLQAKRHVVGACVYSAGGKQFAAYGRDSGPGGFSCPSPGFEDRSWFDSDRLRVIKPITLHHRRIGAIYLESDLSEIEAGRAKF